MFCLFHITKTLVRYFWRGMSGFSWVRGCPDASCETHFNNSYRRIYSWVAQYGDGLQAQKLMNEDLIPSRGKRFFSSLWHADLYPSGTGWPSYIAGHWVPCTSPLTTPRAMVEWWRYSNPPTTWRARSPYVYPQGDLVQSQSHVTTDGQSLSMSWCPVHAALDGLHPNEL
jgi:hypothetical protein